ncbi:unnamed protein product [Hydatigera taeniaeformis]|uniref:ELM2 domain-containing protein n=1 Tax=Hydatigena taeniaeformis TaxID=6205 RepID=A0A0R3WKL1_HYDTA|nr:unnamed protein product [Hydatigera taeniaeformis]
MSEVGDALEDDLPQQVALNTVTPPHTDAGLHFEEDCDFNTTFPTSKRKRRRRKLKNFKAGFEDECSVKKSEPFVAIHQPFHRIVFDEDGNASDVVLRPQHEYQINRKHQKRLATSSYKWSSCVERNADIIGVVSTESKTYTLPSDFTCAVEKPEAKNLEVRIHHFSNDYEAVVNYWYTTLEWLDRAAMGDIDHETSEGKSEEEELGDEESYSNQVKHNELSEETLEDDVKVNDPSTGNDMKNNALENREDAEDNGTIMK